MYQSLLTGGRPQTTLTNLITNGNFASGTTGWISDVGSSISAASNTLSATGNGSRVYLLGAQVTAIAAVSGDKIYARGKLSLSANASTLRIGIGGNAGGTQLIICTNSPVADTQYTISALSTLDASDTVTIQIGFYGYYVDGATQNGKVMQLQEALALNLTTIFGAGLEPTAAQMDRWLTIFSAGWFNTTKLIPKRIY